MAFEPENDLERALMKAPNDESARPEFYRQLLESQLYVLGDMNGNQMSLTMTEHSGHNYHLAFSALSRLQAFVKQEEKYLQLKGRDLFAATKGAYFMLNPGADYGKELLPEEIAWILDPKPVHREVTVEQDTSVLIGQPKNPPTALLDALSAAFNAHRDVTAAHMCQVVSATDAASPHILIGVDTAAPETIDAIVGPVIEKTRIGLTIDVVPIARDGAHKALSDSLLQYPPFYRRAS